MRFNQNQLNGFGNEVCEQMDRQSCVVSLAPFTQARAWLRDQNVMAERLASQLAVHGPLVVHRRVGGIPQQTDSVVAVDVRALFAVINSTKVYRGCWRQQVR
jgi:hypothetical protein